MKLIHEEEVKTGQYYLYYKNRDKRYYRHFNILKRVEGTRQVTRASFDIEREPKNYVTTGKCLARNQIDRFGMIDMVLGRRGTVDGIVFELTEEEVTSHVLLETI